MESERREVIRSITQKSAVQIIDVKEKDYDQQLGFLAGITGFKRMNPGKNKNSGGNGQTIAGEMIIFCGMNSEQIDEFLDLWKNSRQPKIELKAAVTPVNIFWTPRMLYMELLKEQAFFQQKM